MNLLVAIEWDWNTLAITLVGAGTWAMINGRMHPLPLLVMNLTGSLKTYGTVAAEAVGLSLPTP